MQERTAPVEEVRYGHVRIQRRLGAGGMGEVFLGFHEGFQTLVAVKVLPDRLADTQAADRFAREAQVAVKLDHPHIVRVFDVGTDHERAWLVMEYLEGHDLEAYARDHGDPLAVSEALRMIGHAARALAHAHEAGVIHRDIKPSNLFRRDSDGLVKVLDFGLARAKGMDQLTSGDALLGTLPYMAYEQLMGNPCPASDVYSLGVTLYRLLAGELPVSGDLSDVLCFHHGAGAPPLSRFRSLPANIEALVARMMAHEPEQRPTARAVAEEIDALLKEMGGSESGRARLAGDLLEPSPPLRRRRRLRWVGVAAIAVLLAAIGAHQVARRTRHGDPAKPACLGAAVLVVPEFQDRGLVEDWVQQVIAPPGAGGPEIEVVREGSGVRFAFRCEQPAHVYVFNVDAKGSPSCVFPGLYERLFARDLGLGRARGEPVRNPLAPRHGEVLVPPLVETPEGWAAKWFRFDASRGTEWFILAASLRPVPAIEDFRSRIERKECKGDELMAWVERQGVAVAAPDAIDVHVFADREERALTRGWKRARSDGCLTWVVQLEHQ